MDFKDSLIFMKVSYYHNFMQSPKTGLGLIDYRYQEKVVMFNLFYQHLAVSVHQIT